MNGLKRAAVAGLAALLVAPAGLAADGDACKAVRFSDVGWTDITANTALASRVLEGLVYEPSEVVLVVSVT